MPIGGVELNGKFRESVARLAAPLGGKKRKTASAASRAFFLPGGGGETLETLALLPAEKKKKGGDLPVQMGAGKWEPSFRPGERKRGEMLRYHPKP